MDELDNLVDINLKLDNVKDLQKKHNKLLEEQNDLLRELIHAINQNGNQDSFDDMF